MASLDAEIQGALQREEFGAVNRVLESAKTRLPGPQWKVAVEKRQRELGEQMLVALERVQQKARAARAAGNSEEVDALIRKVESWDETLVPALEQAIAAVAPPSPPPAPEEPARSPEARSYLLQWQQAMSKAAARDYAGAIADLERSRAALKEDAVRKELAQDLNDLKDIDRLYQSVIAAQAASRTLALSTAM